MNDQNKQRLVLTERMIQAGAEVLVDWHRITTDGLVTDREAIIEIWEAICAQIEWPQDVSTGANRK